MDEINVSSIEAGIAVVEINQPTKRNAVSAHMREQLIEALESSIVSDSQAVILRGNGSDFCAGVDLKEVGGEQDARGEEIHTRIFTVFRSCPALIIAAVQGFALGFGSGLAMASDIVIAADDAVFGYPEIAHDLVPGMTLVGLREIIGPRRALELLVTGRRVPAVEALQLGMVNEVVASAVLDARALELARKLSGFGKTPLQATKRIFFDTIEMPFDEALRSGARAVKEMRLQPSAIKKASGFVNRSKTSEETR